MKTELTIPQFYEVEYLRAKIGVRYWEDGEIDGEGDEDGSKTPCKEGDYWVPIIHLNTGRITNWEQGKTASIHYKSCDDNVFTLLDLALNEVIEIEGYVINMMCPAEHGFGDYVIMDIDADGYIQNFQVDFSEFQANQD